jgi:para-nitrobenzyl esterase
MKKWLVVAVLAAAIGCAASRDDGPGLVPPGSSEPAATVPSQQETPMPTATLAGTSWRLVRFESGDDTVLMPEDPSKYMLAFDDKGGVSVRIDCNRGRGRYTVTAPSGLEFGPLAMTRAMCPPAPLTDRLPKDLAYVRSFVMRDGHLFLSLFADGGIYEFEPAPGA